MSYFFNIKVLVLGQRNEKLSSPGIEAVARAAFDLAVVAIRDKVKEVMVQATTRRYLDNLGMKT